jgi:hypothetical protein
MHGLPPSAPCQHWRYAAVVPIRKAKVLPLEDLLTRTNPALAERLQLREQIRALGGDAAFELVYEQVERLRPGALRSSLLKQLLGWNGLAGVHFFPRRASTVRNHVATNAKA